MLSKEETKKLSVLAAKIRLETLKVIHSRGFGHVGGSMDLAIGGCSVWESNEVDPKNPSWEDRDWLVLSKGHAGPVAYATYGLMGYYPMEDAYTLNHPRTRFPSHTDRKLTPGVDLTTGSLGQGVSTAMGPLSATKSMAAAAMCLSSWATERPTRARSGKACILQPPMA